MRRHEDLSFQHQPLLGLFHVREKNGMGPMSLCGLLGYTPLSTEDAKFWGPGLIGRT